MKRRLDATVRSLIGARAGGGGGVDDRKIITIGLNEFADAQRQRSTMLGGALALFLLAPIVLMFSSVPKEDLTYVFGATGIFTAGTLKTLVETISDMSKAHALAVVCQRLNSVDARAVLEAWLKGKE